jgi:hypothetical protein
MDYKVRVAKNNVVINLLNIFLPQFFCNDNVFSFNEKNYL